MFTSLWTSWYIWFLLVEDNMVFYELLGKKLIRSISSLSFCGSLGIFNSGLVVSKGKRKMATEKANVDNSDASFNIQSNSIQQSSNIKHLENCHFGKAVAYRAVYGSSGTSSNGSRKFRDNDAKTSPSRLSKVSVAADNTDN